MLAVDKLLILLVLGVVCLQTECNKRGVCIFSAWPTCAHCSLLLIMGRRWPCFYPDGVLQWWKSVVTAGRVSSWWTQTSKWNGAEAVDSSHCVWTEVHSLSWTGAPRYQTWYVSFCYHLAKPPALKVGQIKPVRWGYQVCKQVLLRFPTKFSFYSQFWQVSTDPC